MSFRVLYEQLVDYRGEDVFGDVLTPALPAAMAEMRPVGPLRSLRDAPPGQCADEALFSLFALSVVNDYLLLPHRVSSKEYRAFFTALGFSVGRPDVYDPLLCEICEVVDAPKKEAGIAFHAIYWPLVTFGELVFSRAGGRVFCHRDHGIVKGIAERSTLYFTNRRLHRPAADLSHGWGSNSRWRTKHARNYRTPTHAVFNADGRIDLSVAAPVPSEPNGNASLPIDARRELLVHRCFVAYVDTEAEGERWPYDDTLIVDAPTAWPLDPGAFHAHGHS